LLLSIAANALTPFIHNLPVPQFFISPLFTEGATGREMNAVDAENAKNQQTDVWRMMQLKKSLAREDHPYHNFGTGNLETLKVHSAPIKTQTNVPLKRELSCLNCAS
jgi:secreted Zn-dependent insulinase-like peptidase